MTFNQLYCFNKAYLKKDGVGALAVTISTCLIAIIMEQVGCEYKNFL